MRELLALIVSLTALLPSGASYSQTPPVAASADQVAAIRRLLSSTFEKPETRLLLDPIVVEENAALVGWIQGDLAGRAFLRDRDGHWVITACGGDALKDASTLQRLGLSQAPPSLRSKSLAATRARHLRSLPVPGQEMPRASR